VDLRPLDYANRKETLEMLKVYADSNNQFIVGVQLRIRDDESGSAHWFPNYDPLLRYLVGGNQWIVPIQAVTSRGLGAGNFHDTTGIYEVSYPPRSSKVKENFAYDEKYYGTFVDSIQSFGSVLRGTTTSPPGLIWQQHYVRHPSFRGQASAGIQSLVDGSMLVSWLSEYNLLYNIELPRYPSVNFHVSVDPLGNADFDYDDGGFDVYDITPVFRILKDSGNYSYRYDAGYPTEFNTTISGFDFSTVGQLRFSYNAYLSYTSGGTLWEYSYRVYYNSGLFGIISDVGVDPRIVGLGTQPAEYGVTNYSSNDSSLDNFVTYANSTSAGFVVGKPLVTGSKDITEYQLSVKLQPYYVSFRDSVELNWWDITALSRDTATSALNKLANSAIQPSFGRIRALNPVKITSESILAHTANAALGDFLRMTLKEILRLGGGSGLVKYRTLFSDCLQLIGALDALRAMRNAPSELYVVNA